MKTVFTILCALLLNFSAFAKQKQPNIIFILIDDQGYYDLGCYGATEIKTPRIDAIAKEGMRFTDYYAAAPICSPSRAGLLTGCYPRRVGNHIWVHRADSATGIHPNELTLAELLKANGYATACIGKWHLGFHEPFLPRNQGFDHYYGLLHNLDPVEIVYFEKQGGVPLIRNGKVIKRPADPAELTRLYTDEAVKFIGANKEHPFFLYLPHTMLHVPLGVSEPFKGKSNWGEYGDAIQELDHHVGRIVDALKKNKIDDNTLVIYASDNGRGPGRNPAQKLRGRKLSTSEAGIRVPFIVSWPGQIASGGKYDEPVIQIDIFPTVLAAAGIDAKPEKRLDGVNLLPFLHGETSGSPHEALYWRFLGQIAIRRGNWKLVSYFAKMDEGELLRSDPRDEMTPLRLYNLKRDIGESQDLSQQEPQVAA